MFRVIGDMGSGVCRRVHAGRFGVELIVRYNEKTTMSRDIVLFFSLRPVFPLPYNKERERVSAQEYAGAFACLCMYAARPPGGKRILLGERKKPC